MKRVIVLATLVTLMAIAVGVASASIAKRFSSRTTVGGRVCHTAAPNWPKQYRPGRQAKISVSVINFGCTSPASQNFDVLFPAGPTDAQLTYTSKPMIITTQSDGKKYWTWKVRNLRPGQGWRGITVKIAVPSQACGLWPYSFVIANRTGGANSFGGSMSATTGRPC